MNLLSFGGPAYYSACQHCGNALMAGDDDCPHCGASQSRALVVSNAMAFNNRNYLAVPSRMLVSYPSVPEEVDTARNRSRQRASKVRKAAFRLTLGAMVASALALAYGPGMRSPAVTRLAAQPEPVPAQAVDITQSFDTPNGATVAEGGMDNNADANTAAAVEPSPFIAKDAEPLPALKAQVQTAPTPAIEQTAHASVPVAASAHEVKAPSITLADATPRPAAVQALMPAAASAAEIEAHVLAIANTAPPAPATVQPATPVAAPLPVAKAPITVTAKALQNRVQPVTQTHFNFDEQTLFAFITPSVKADAAAAFALARQTVAQEASRIKNEAVQIKVTLAGALASHATKKPSTAEASPNTAQVAPPAFPVPSAPEPTADVPLASHTAQSAEPVIAPAAAASLTAERPAAGTPAERLYLATLALNTNDLSAVRKNLAALPADQSSSDEANRIREELVHRESARNAAMLRARACDSTASFNCARKSAKEALAIDTSYGDSRLFLKRVYIEVAQAKKAKRSVPEQTASAPVEFNPVADTLREINVPKSAVPGTIHSAPITHAAPTRELREVRLEPVFQEAKPLVREPSASVVPAESASIFNTVEPIRPAGRGDAH